MRVQNKVNKMADPVVIDAAQQQLPPDGQIPVMDPSTMENFKMPSLEELLKMLEGMDMDETEKENIRKHVIARADSGEPFGSPAGFGGGTPGRMPRLQATFNDYIVLLIMLAILVLIFGKITIRKQLSHV